jgi:hypothetical protein
VFGEIQFGKYGSDPRQCISRYVSSIRNPSLGRRCRLQLKLSWCA